MCFSLIGEYFKQNSKSLSYLGLRLHVVKSSSFVSFVVVDMPEINVQRMCIKFCSKLGKNATETHKMIKTYFGNNAWGRDFRIVCTFSGMVESELNTFVALKDSRQSRNDDVVRENLRESVKWSQINCPWVREWGGNINWIFSWKLNEQFTDEQDCCVRVSKGIREKRSENGKV